MRSQACLSEAHSLGTILLASWEAFFLIKWVGAAYLIWLGLTMVVARGAGDIGTATPPTPMRTGRRTWLHGMITQGANPKALVFFTAFLPQFVNPAEPLAPQIAILAATSILIEFGVLASYAALASRVSHFAQRPRFASVFHRVGGAMLIGAGAGLAALKRT